MSDPVKNYYIAGYEDAKAGRANRRVPYNFKLAYVNGRCDFLSNKPNKYEER